MRLVGETFPLLIYVAPKQYDANSVRQMAQAFEEYFARAERYAVLSVQPSGSSPPAPTERKMISDWVTSARVREQAGKLCVCSAASIDSAIMRGALTAVMWFWKPPFPLEMVASPGQGVDFCLAHLVRAGVSLPRSAASLKMEAMKVLESSL